MPGSLPALPKKLLWGGGPPELQSPCISMPMRPAMEKRRPKLGRPARRASTRLATSDSADVESARAMAAARVRQRRREDRARWQQELEELATRAVAAPEEEDDDASGDIIGPSFARASTPRTVLRQGYSRSADIADRAAAAAGMRQAAAAAARARSFLSIARKRAAVYARQAEDKMRAAAANAHEAARTAARDAAAASGSAPTAHDEAARRGAARAHVEAARRSSTGARTGASARCSGDFPWTGPRCEGRPPSRHSHYSVLGVGRHASATELKKAFFRLALKYHPDRSKSPEATALMMRINEAYSCLIDPAQRLLYDAVQTPRPTCAAS